MLDETFKLFSLNSSEYIYSNDEESCQIFNTSIQLLDIQNDINLDKSNLINKGDFKNNQSIDHQVNHEKFDLWAEENKESNSNEDNSDNNFNTEKLYFYNNLGQEIKKLPFQDTKSQISLKIKNINQIKDIYKNDTEKYFFPFTPGKGTNISKLSDEAKIVIQNDEIKCNELDSEKSSKENSTSSELIINNKNNIYDIQFMTKKYNIMPDGKKRKIKKLRKFKSDDIRKKIKSRFHKTLKDLINEGLKKAGSIKLFDFIPHYFINNVTRKINSKFLDLTYKDLLSYNFINEEYKEKSLNKEVDYKKFLINQEVLKYLEQHENISKSSGFDIIKNKKYKDLLNIYFSSLEFENSITRLKSENENNDYIQEYIFTAKHYVEFFTNNNGDENKEIKNINII